MMRKLCPLLLAIALSVSSCAPKLPPPGVYSAQQERIYKTEDFEQTLIALSRTTITLNQQGALSDADTRLVRDFVLSADAARVSYANGAGTLRTVKTAFATLNEGLAVDVKANATLKAALSAVQTIIEILPEAP